MPSRRSTPDSRPGPSTKGTAAPRLDVVDPDGLVDMGTDLLTAREHRELERYADADLTDRDLEGATFSECVFEAVRLGGAKLRGARFVESVLSDSFAPELSAPRTTWRDVRIGRPRWGSAELFDASVQSVRLVGGKIDFLNFRGAELVDLQIEGCSIGELDLGGVRARRVALVDCRVGVLDVTRASLSDVDLRTTDIARIDGVEGLRGATIDDLQLSLMAHAFADHLGVRVE
ncbi:pentapeptide repeat-containing protein [Frigoribacterium sp. 2-23]|uniref:pentapeptide repeat-containing protein n=1 Tax=Frigoribacterium sp. 2-23 TaxID=3415006 RepID=UPI003C7055BA